MTKSWRQEKNASAFFELPATRAQRRCSRIFSNLPLPWATADFPPFVIVTQKAIEKFVEYGKTNKWESKVGSCLPSPLRGLKTSQRFKGMLPLG
jgi:hypothetical protein